MRVVHLSPQSDQPKRGKLSNNKEAIRAWVQVWKVKNNERLYKQNSK